MSAQLRSAQRQYESLTPCETSEGILGDLGATHEFIADLGWLHDANLDVIAEYLTGPRDVYADRKLMRQVQQIADRCHEAICADEQKKADQSWADAEEARMESAA